MITKQMVISDVIVNYPEAAEKLTEFGIHCVGCHVSAFETLEQGMSAHGMTDKDIDKAVEELNKLAKDKPKKTKGTINITEEAAKKLNELLKENKKKALRLSVVAGGCSGFRYGMDLVNEHHPDDIIIDKDSIKVFIDKAGMQYLDGITLNYVDSLQGAGFKIENPNAQKSCGCGSSFG